MIEVDSCHLPLPLTSPPLPTRLSTLSNRIERLRREKEEKERKNTHTSETKSENTMEKNGNTVIGTPLRPSSSSMIPPPSSPSISSLFSPPSSPSPCPSSSSSSLPPPAPFLSCAVSSPRFRQVLRDSFTEYRLEIFSPALRWEMWKRFSEFKSLHEELEKYAKLLKKKGEKEAKANKTSYSSASPSSISTPSYTLPPFPPSRLIGNYANTFLLHRCSLLQSYLSLVLANEIWATSMIVLIFVGMGERVITAESIEKGKDGGDDGETKHDKSDEAKEKDEDKKMRKLTNGKHDAIDDRLRDYTLTPSPLHASSSPSTTSSTHSSLLLPTTSPRASDVPSLVRLPSTLHLDALLPLLDVGDLILFRTPGVLPSLQRKFTNSRWDHVALVVRCPPPVVSHASALAKARLSTPAASRHSSGIVTSTSGSNNAISLNIPLLLSMPSMPLLSFPPPPLLPSSLRLLEATGEGVRLYALGRRLRAWHLSGSRMVVRRLKLDSSASAAAAAAAAASTTTGTDEHASVGGGIIHGRSELFRKQMDAFVNEVEGLNYGLTVGKLLRRSPAQTITASASSTSANTTTNHIDSATVVSTPAPTSSSSTYFCSELIAAAYMRVGLLDPNHLPASSFFPSSFSQFGRSRAHPRARSMKGGGALRLLDNASLEPEMMIGFVQPAVKDAEENRRGGGGQSENDDDDDDNIVESQRPSSRASRASLIFTSTSTTVPSTPRRPSLQYPSSTSIVSSSQRSSLVAAQTNSRHRLPSSTGRTRADRTPVWSSMPSSALSPSSPFTKQRSVMRRLSGINSRKNGAAISSTSGGDRHVKAETSARDETYTAVYDQIIIPSSPNHRDHDGHHRGGAIDRESPSSCSSLVSSSIDIRCSSLVRLSSPATRSHPRLRHHLSESPLASHSQSSTMDGLEGEGASYEYEDGGGGDGGDGGGDGSNSNTSSSASSNSINSPAVMMMRRIKRNTITEVAEGMIISTTPMPKTMVTMTMTMNDSEDENGHTILVGGGGDNTTQQGQPLTPTITRDTAAGVAET